MNSIAFYNKFNDFAHSLQKLACRLSNKDARLARELYIETSYHAFKHKNEAVSYPNFLIYLAKTMGDILLSMKNENWNIEKTNGGFGAPKTSNQFIDLINKLDNQLKPVFLLSYKGLSNVEIARQLEESEDEIESSLKQAKHQLKELIKYDAQLV